MRSSMLAVFSVTAVVAASPALASALVSVDSRVARPLNDLSIRDPMNLDFPREELIDIERRVSADFSLDRQWQNELLFGGSWTNVGSQDAENVGLSVTCVECWTNGTVTAKLATEDVIKPVVRLQFAGVEAYVELDVKTTASATYSINLFSTNTPVGFSLPDLELGLVFSVDLVFSVSAAVDLEGGFYVKLADDAFLDTDIFGGDIADSFFDGIQSKSIPVTVNSGSAIFKADLRLRVQCGAQADLDIFGIGAGAMVGIYANILEFVADLDSTPSCGMETREWFDLNVGAYAHLDVKVDYKTFGAVPTVSTTLFDSPTFTQCWDGGSPTASGSGIASGVSIRPTSVSAGTTPVAVSSTGRLTEPSVAAVEPSASSMASGFSTTLRANRTLIASPTISSARHSASSSHRVPLANSSMTTAVESFATSTVFRTTVYTVTSCAASVVNCPASLEKHIVVTHTVDASTTVCPAGATVTPPMASTNKASALRQPTVTAARVVSQLVAIPKISPKVQTFVEPASIEHVQETITATPASVLTSSPVESQRPDENIKAFGIQQSTSKGPESYSPVSPAEASNRVSTANHIAPTAPVQATGNNLHVKGLAKGAVACAGLAVLAGCL